MAVMREKTDLDKKWTWYLFLAANVVVLIGCAITYVLIKNATSNEGTIFFVPSLVCNISALILAGIFIWLEAKNTMPKIVHFRRKWLWWYLAALITFVVSIIFNFIFLIVYYNQIRIPITADWPLIIYMVITGVLTLVAIGIQRYARYKIDLDIYRRNHGELPKKDEIAKDEAKLKQSQSEAKTEQKLDQPKATSGLSDSIDKQ